MTPLPDHVRTTARRAGIGFGLLTGVAFCLIVFGAIVRAHGAGLACPDWPLCYGEAIPLFNFWIALEWGHRVLASAASLGLLAATAVVVRRPELRLRLRVPLVGVWVALGVQVVLGGLTVLLGLAPWTVTAHLLVGHTFFALLLWLCRDLRQLGAARPVSSPSFPPALSAAVWACAALLVLQVALGGLVSANYAGLACSSFPTCDGESFVPRLSGLVGLHVVHRFGALLLTAAWIALAVAARGSGRAPRAARIGLRLVIFQVGVGIANVLVGIPVDLTALHSGLAAGLTLVTVLLVRDAARARLRVPVVGSGAARAMEAA